MAVRDSGGPRDSGGGTCRSVDAATVCVDDETRPFLSARESTSVLVYTDDCHCGGELSCEVRVDGADIHLDMSICGEMPCRACTAPSQVRCEVPPVAPGPHRVLVGGESAFELAAMESGGGPPTTLCQHIGSRGGGLCSFPGSLGSWRPDRVCYREPALRGAVEIIFEKDETSCAIEPGPCDVYASETGFEIRPRARTCDEGSSTWGCTGMSGRLRRSCRVLDAVPAGSFPMQLQDGTSLGTITIRDDEIGDEVCIELPP